MIPEDVPMVPEVGGIFDLMPLLEEIMDVEELAKFSYDPPTYRAAWLGHEKANGMICSRCGAYVEQSSLDGEGMDAHNKWHRNLSASIWMLQGFVVSHIGTHLEAEAEADRQEQIERERRDMEA